MNISLITTAITLLSLATQIMNVDNSEVLMDQRRSLENEQPKYKKIRYHTSFTLKHKVGAQGKQQSVGDKYYHVSLYVSILSCDLSKILMITRLAATSELIEKPVDSCVVRKPLFLRERIKGVQNHQNEHKVEIKKISKEGDGNYTINLCGYQSGQQQGCDVMFTISALGANQGSYTHKKIKIVVKLQDNTSLLGQNKKSHLSSN